MNKLFYVDCSPLFDDNKLQTILPYLDNLRRQRVARLATPEKKAQCAAAGWLLTQLFGKDGQPPMLTHGSRGKPYLAGQDAMFFSLSHTGKWVICAVSDKEIGADVQEVTAYRQTVAGRCFTADETAWVDSDPQRFTRLWTMKEAYLKYTGFGLVLPMSSFTVPYEKGGWDKQQACYYQTLSIPGEAVIVTVCTGDPTPINFTQAMTI